MKLFDKLTLKFSHWFSVDMRYVFKSLSILTFGQILIIINGIAVSLILPRIFSKEQFGEYQYILSLMSFFVIFNLSGLNQSLTRTIARGQEGNFLEVFISKLRWGLLAIPVGLGIIYFTNLGEQSEDLISLVIMASIFAPLCDSCRLFLDYYIGKKDFSNFVKNNLILRILPSILLISVSVLYVNITVSLSFFFVFNGILSIYCILFFIKKNSFNKEIDSDTLPYGKKVSFINLFSNLTKPIDKLIVFNFLGALELASYAIAMIPFMYMKRPILSMGKIVMPKLAVGDFESQKKKIKKLITKLFVLSLIPVFIYILLAPYVLPFIFPGYENSVILTQILSLSILFFPQSLIAFFFMAKKSFREMFWQSVLFPIVKVVLYLIAVSQYGVIGLAAAFVTVECIRFILSLILLFRCKEIPELNKDS